MCVQTFASNILTLVTGTQEEHFGCSRLHYSSSWRLSEECFERPDLVLLMRWQSGSVKQKPSLCV